MDTSTIESVKVQQSTVQEEEWEAALEANVVMSPIIDGQQVEGRMSIQPVRSSSKQKPFPANGLIYIKKQD